MSTPPACPTPPAVPLNPGGGPRPGERARRTRWPLPLLMLLALLWAPQVHALELYSLLSRTCEQHTGLIVHADEQAVFLLTPQGGLDSVQRDAVSRILVYNTLDNPFPVLELAGDLGALAREITLSHSGEEEEAGSSGDFVGWPIRFEEDAIIFFDIQGRTHIENLDRIVGFHPLETLPGRQTLPDAKPLAFRLGPNVADCEDVADARLPPVYPTRVIGDQININRFLAAFNEGFHALERFRQRTAYYARPFLFDRRTKLGLQLGNFEMFPLAELPSSLPFYFQWSSGSNYASQGLIAVGSRPVEWLPNVEPLFSLRSDVKSGFFSASFAGNPLAFSAGSTFVVENRFAYQERFSQLGRDDVAVYPHFNHIALTGVDWGAYTLSAGFYYPLTAIYGGGRFREVPSVSPSTLWRMLYTTQKLQTRLLYSSTLLGSDHPEDRDITLVQASDMRQPGTLSEASLALPACLQRFSLDARFMRLGFDWELPRDLQVGVDQVLLTGIYREYLDEDFFRLNYTHHVTSLHVGQSFGAFVALRATLNAFDRRYESHELSGRDDQTYNDLSLTVAIEFVL